MTTKRTPHSSKRTTKKSKKAKVLMTLESPVALKPEAVKRMKDAYKNQNYKTVKRPIGVRLGEGVQVLLNGFAKKAGVARNKVIEAAIVAACSGQIVLNFEEETTE